MSICVFVGELIDLIMIIVIYILNENPNENRQIEKFFVLDKVFFAQRCCIFVLRDPCAPPPPPTA